MIKAGLLQFYSEFGCTVKSAGELLTSCCTAAIRGDLLFVIGDGCGGICEIGGICGGGGGKQK